MKTLQEGDAIFLVNSTPNRPDDVRLCSIGEVTEDTAILVVKPASPNGTGKAVLRTLGRHFLGEHPVDSTEKVREASRIAGTTYQLPTPRLYALLADKLERQEIRTLLEDIKESIITFDASSLSLFHKELTHLLSLAKEINQTNGQD